MYQNLVNLFIMSQNSTINHTFFTFFYVVPHDTAIRQKQLAEFNEEEKDLLESISALKSAVTVLSKEGDFERRST